MVAWDDWLPRQRWYAGRDRVPAAVRIHAMLPLREGIGIALLDVDYDDGSADRYQVLTPSDVDADSARVLLALIADGAVCGPVRFTREPGAAPPVGAESRVIDAEQSNTSVVFGQRAVLKLFRRVCGGVNPDIELNRVLSRTGSPHVAGLLGSFELADAGEVYQLGMLSEYAPEAVDGWRLATADPDGFITDCALLGETVAAVHAALSHELGTSTAAMPVDRMLRRLAAAADSVPALAGFLPAIRERYSILTGVPVTVQRIHGDLHLGQVLRTWGRWLVIDFEGEPGQPLDIRRRPDSPLRDVAGMLRSFDYVTAGAAAPRSRMGELFCAGYAARAGVDLRQHAGVLAAYELDKAVYEAAYEARHRPDWLGVPLRSIARLLGEDPG